jgi:hypothetical protein
LRRVRIFLAEKGLEIPSTDTAIRNTSTGLKGRAIAGLSCDRRPRFVLLRRVAELSGLPGGQRLDVRSFQRFAADRPVAAFELIDANPGDAAHILAFDLDHRRSNLSDEVLLLLGGENVLNHIDRNERHVISPSDLNTAAGTAPPLVIEVEHAPDAHA